jgi:hypothetical protein
MKIKLAMFLALAVLLSLGVMPVHAQETPPLPHAFYGTVEINGQPAPIGTQVEAGGDNVITGISGNPIITTELGKYGGPGLSVKLIVPGFIEEGTIISFYINNVLAEQTAEWHSGEVTELNLGVTITTPMVTLTPISSPTNNPSPTFSGTASSTENNIASVEYKVDEGGWTAASASDGAFDSQSEGFTFTTSSLSDGSHTVWVRATDAAGGTTPEANYASQSFTVDTVAPTVVSSSPESAASNVSRHPAVLTATFSEDVARTSIVFTLGDVSGDVNYNKADFTASFILSAQSNLEPETEYTASISAKDLAGNPMSQAYTWSFTTGEWGTIPDTTPPSVISTSPANGASNISINVTISSLFSEVIDETTLEFTLDGLAGSVSYDQSSSIATFTPGSHLASNTSYTASISAEDLAGNPMSTYTWSFSTKVEELPPPTAINWTLIWSIVGGIIVVALIVVLVRRRRA